MQDIKLKRLDHLSRGVNIDFLNVKTARGVAAFHAGFPEYAPTPLVALKRLAAHLGVAGVYVKDESKRFGLNAFKALGASYAIGKIVEERLGTGLSELSFQRLNSDEVRARLGDMTFVTATDGNHGRGVAWTARQLRQNSVVYMPRGSAQERADRIAAEGAKVHILDANYDEAVRLANSLAREKGYVLVQDTAWEGYEEIPRFIMQGYLTLAHEAAEELDFFNSRPTHVFVQAGVGSLAAAVTGYFTNRWQGEQTPSFTVVEPSAVDCIYRSATQGQRVCIGGAYHTLMAGLSCGEPNTLGLQILLDHAENYLSIPEEVAAFGMRVLGNPLGEDARVVSGESGAAPVGAAVKILTEPGYGELRRGLGLDKDSVLLFISTEGDTDWKGYRSVVWDGAYPSAEQGL